MSPANSIGFPFIELRKVESTNNYAMGLIHEGMAQHGEVVFAHEQTKGKGQRDKKWVSAPGQNIMLSLILQPFHLDISQGFLLSMSVANGLQRFFNFYSGANTKVKWPNDIYWCDRKAAGILIENIIQGKVWKYAVIGIGLNVNQTNFGSFNATSLKSITGTNYNTVELAKHLILFLEKSFEELVGNLQQVSSVYHSHLYKLNEKILFKKGDQIIQGIFKGVSDEGMLVVKEQDNESFFRVGEIEWLNDFIK